VQGITIAPIVRRSRAEADSRVEAA